MTTAQTAEFSPEAFLDALRKADMTPGQFAEELGVSRGTVGTWMAGVAEPKRANLKQTARILGIKESDLLAPESA